MAESAVEERVALSTAPWASPEARRKPASKYVHVVDDDNDVRHALRELFESAGFKVSVFASADEVLKAPRDTFHDGCFVIDVRMPGRMDGIDLLGELTARGVKLPAMVLSGHATVPLAVRAMRLGAVDVVSKPFNPEVLINAVEAAIARAATLALPASDPFRVEARQLIERLTVREAEVLRSVLEGKSSKEIAMLGSQSHRTIENHRAHILKKLGVDNWIDAQRLAQAAGVSSVSLDLSQSSAA